VHKGREGRLAELPPTFPATRAAVHRLATHVLARRRHDVCGKFGLRATPGGIGTPAFGPEHEVVRISGTTLVRERTGQEARTQWLDLGAATLVEAADLDDVDLSAPFSVGRDTPPLGEPDDPLALDAVATGRLADWYWYGWTVLDAVLGSLGLDTEPSVTQLWPEHFDAAFHLAAGRGRANVGASPGDDHVREPYLYLGPWGDERPGDPAYWNAPFGAVLTYGDLLGSPAPVEDGTRFLERGLAFLSSLPSA
jgi:hypothetical protein